MTIVIIIAVTFIIAEIIAHIIVSKMSDTRLIECFKLANTRMVIESVIDATYTKVSNNTILYELGNELNIVGELLIQYTKKQSKYDLVIIYTHMDKVKKLLYRLTVAGNIIDFISGNRRRYKRYKKRIAETVASLDRIREMEERHAVKHKGVTYYETKRGFCFKDEKNTMLGIFNTLDEAVNARTEYFKQLGE